MRARRASTRRRPPPRRPRRGRSRAVRATTTRRGTGRAPPAGGRPGRVRRAFPRAAPAPPPGARPASPRPPSRRRSPSATHPAHEERERLDPPLDLDARRGREHHHRAGQGDQREGDQQRDDDSGGLVDLDTDGVPGREHKATDPEARRPRLLQRDVQPVGIVHPDQRLVHRLPGIRCEVRGDQPVRHPHPGRAGQGIGHVVGRDSDADDAQLLGRDRWGGCPEADRVAGLEVPLLGQPLLDHRLAGAVAQVAAGDDGVAAPARLHPLQLPAGDLGDPVRPQVDAPLLVPVGDAGHVGQRTHPLAHGAQIALVEPGDHVRQVGAVGGPLETVVQAERHRHRRTQHRRRGCDAARGEQGPAPADRSRATAWRTSALIGQAGRRRGAGRGRRGPRPRCRASPAPPPGRHLRSRGAAGALRAPIPRRGCRSARRQGSGAGR